MKASRFGRCRPKEQYTLKLSEKERKFLVSVLNTFYEEFPSKLTDKQCRDMVERLEGTELQWA